MIKSPNPQDGDLFGNSLAISADGRSILVGAPGAAAAYWFTDIDPANQTPQNSKTVKLVDNSRGSQFGWAVALSGNGKAAAVSMLSTRGADYGSVAVLRMVGDKVTQKELSSKQVGMLYGYSLAMSSNGKILLIGSPLSEGGTGAVFREKID